MLIAFKSASDWGHVGYGKGGQITDKKRVIDEMICSVEYNIFLAKNIINIWNYLQTVEIK